MPFRTSATTVARTTPAAVWALYEDPTRWPVWDPELTRCTLNGPFAPGTRGTMQPTGAPRVSFQLTDVVRESRFADVTPFPHRLLPLAHIHFTHELDRVDAERTRITHKVEITGPLGPLVSRMLGPSFASDVPHAVARLADLAEALTSLTEPDAQHAA
jgi:uncharacterized protein YndB with AHSA1/START domain